VTRKRYRISILPIRRHHVMPPWWPFQENLFGHHHLRRPGFSYSETID
jgi:hypothetical protein